jgi:sigma-E factor negative regulatory protein RseC
MEAEAINTAGGKIGDRVMLQIAAGSLVKISLILYVVPVIAFIAGAVLGMKLLPPIKMNREIFAFCTGVVGCAISFLMIRVFSHRISRDANYIPEVVKLLGPVNKTKIDQC